MLKQPQKTMMFDGGRKVKIYYSRSDRSECFLNPELIRKQKLTWLRVGQILRLHKDKDDLFEKMRKLPITEVNTLRTLARFVTRNEYALQKAWGFRKNKIWHRFWELPHCTCPKMDNDDMYPSKHGYYISGDCVYHAIKSHNSR